MRKTLIRSTLLALIVSLFTIVPVLAYTYSAYITVTESGGNNYTQSPFNVFMDNDYLATQGYITDDGLDVNVSVNGALVPRMVVSDRTLFVSDLAANHTITPLLTTGNTPTSSMDLIVGNDGYIETVDDASMEIGSDQFHLKVEGYYDTSKAANKYIVFKDSAVALRSSSTAEERIIAIFNGVPTTALNISSGYHKIEMGNSAVKLAEATDQYIQVPDSDLLEPGNSDFTISAWVNFTNVVGTYTIFMHRESDVSNNRQQVAWNSVNNKLNWAVYSGGAEILMRSTDFFPVADTWYNFIFVRSGNDFETYIDGIVAGATTTAAITIPEMNNGIYIGAVTSTISNMNGKYQNFRWLGRAITAGEIAAYQTCTYTDDTDLELFLRCDEDSGSDVVDYSTNGLDSEVINGCSRGDGLYDYLYIDDVFSGIVMPKETIPDNANNWFFMQNNVMSYADSIELVINETVVLDYEPTTMLTAVVNPASPYTTGTATFTTGTNTVTGAGGATWTRDMIGGQIKCDGDAVYYKIIDVPAATTITLNTEYLEAGGAGEAYTIDTFNLTATLDDNSASANDGTITFGANPLGVVTTIGALTSSTVITTTPTIAPDLANLESNQGDLISTPYPNPTLSNNLLTPWFTPWSQLTNIPLVAFFLILGTVILIVSVVWIMKRTNNQLIASFVLIAGEAILWKLGIYELWPVIVTSIICFAIIVWERKPSI